MGPIVRFEYRPIRKNREIRLLRILSSATGSSKDWGYELVHTSLCTAPPFEAISYTWGSPEKTHQVLIDGLPFMVSEKVYRLLAAVGSLTRTGYVWIDSICINQTDAVEKSSQIVLMREIYGRASVVIAWLGETDESLAAAAREMVAEFAEQFRSATGNAVEFYLRYVLIPDGRLPALQAFLNNPWFTRMWVIQEVAMSRELHVVYGREKMPWRLLQAAIAFCAAPWVAQSLATQHRRGIQAVSPSMIANALTLAEVRNTIPNERGDFAKSVAFIFRSFGASDPRDKIYAILDLTSAAEHELLKPDYRKTVEEVYASAATYIYLHSPSNYPLRIFPDAGVGSRRNFDHLPSWVPDWSTKLRADSAFEHFATYGNGEDHRVPFQPDRPLFSSANSFSASMNTQPKFDIDLARGVMAIEGFLVDGIVGVSRFHDGPGVVATAMDRWDHLSSMTDYMHEVNLLMRHAKDPYPNGQSLEDVLWRTLVADRFVDYPGMSLQQPAPEHVRDYYRAWKACISAASSGARRAESIDLDLHSVRSQFAASLAKGGFAPLAALWAILTGRSGHHFLWLQVSAGTRYLAGIREPWWLPEAKNKLTWLMAGLWWAMDPERRTIQARLRLALEHQARLTANTDIPSAGVQDNDATSVPDPDPYAVRGALLQHASLSAAVLFFIRAATKECCRRRFCVTKKGYVGLVPEHTQVGDTICIFLGTSTPYLIRRVDGSATAMETHNLVGECYIHGMMYGEMMDLASESRWIYLV
ncbi:hypothetical protein DL764_004353 [Monosporascus ibericus]|uniref:Heterokaryon incompatibility domain-containing protein n=1 Tax=Monosporascus ibericus TaxID=155417 RepID=A0A4Q4TD00_9PEZI|nr:hypothetical protein DL764_004353 [Monosporascus ibericus]